MMRGHQRGRLCGSDTRAQTRSADASIVRERETLGIRGSDQAWAL
jgi:hypothetical protein